MKLSEMCDDIYFILLCKNPQSEFKKVQEEDINFTT